MDILVSTVGTQKVKAAYDVQRMVNDMAVRGWMAIDLARAANVSSMTVSRFFRGEAQTAKTVEKLAKALGYSVRRYLISSANRAVA